MVNEANLIAAELKRNIRFNTKMIRVMPEFGNILDSKTDIMIKVDNNEDNYYYQWQSEKFANRLEMIREKLNEYFNDGVLPKFDSKERDPFWDPPEPLLIGTSYLSLKSLGYTLENKLDCKILSSEGAAGSRGQMMVSYWPVSEDGGEPGDEVLVEEDPKELLGKEIWFRVEIEGAKGLPKDLCKNTFVTYQMKHEAGVVFSTDESKGQNMNPVFNYKHTHHVEMVTDYILDYFDQGNVSKLL